MSEPVTHPRRRRARRLAQIPAGSVQCCVTSPHIGDLGDYGVDGQIGLEATPEAFVAKMVEVRRERRVTCRTTALWLNIGDLYIRASADQVRVRWRTHGKEQRRKRWKAA